MIEAYEIHMVPSNNKTHVSHNVDSSDHVVLRRHPPHGVEGEHDICNSKARNNQNVDLGVSKEPKKVLKQDRISSISKIKKRSLSMPIHEGHEHSSTQDWSYDSKEAECKE